MQAPPLRLSYSSLELLNTCERKFQLVKLLQSPEQDDSEHFSFGHAFGAGVASYAADQDADKALYKAWLAYWPQIETDKKFQTQCFALLMRAFNKLDTLLQDYDTVFHNGKVAAELAFRMDIGEKYYFVGHIDLVLRHKYTGIYTVLEVKSTGLQISDLSANYANSGQAIGYSIALDEITGQKHDRFEVLYLVGQIGRNPFDAEIKVIPFRKTLVDRLNWFVSLGMDVERLERMKELGVYPKRGGSCLTFNRPCKFFQTCGLSSLDFPKVHEEDTTHYDFTFDMNALVDDHLERVKTFIDDTPVALTSHGEASTLLDLDSFSPIPTIPNSGDVDALLDVRF